MEKVGKTLSDSLDLGKLRRWYVKSCLDSQSFFTLGRIWNLQVEIAIKFFGPESMEVEMWRLGLIGMREIAGFLDEQLECRVPKVKMSM